MIPTTNEEWAALCRAQVDTIETLTKQKLAAERRAFQFSQLASGAVGSLETSESEALPFRMYADTLGGVVLEVSAAPQQHAQAETREQAEQRQREVVAKQFAGRAQTSATADFDLPAASDRVEHAQAAQPNKQYGLAAYAHANADSRVGGNAQAALSDEQIGEAVQRGYSKNDGITMDYFDLQHVITEVRAILATRQPAPDALPSIPTDAMCRAAREKIGIGSNIADHVWRVMAAEFGGSIAPVAAAAQGDAVPFAWFVQPGGFGPFLETGPHASGAFPAYRSPNKGGAA